MAKRDTTANETSRWRILAGILLLASAAIFLALSFVAGEAAELVTERPPYVAPTEPRLAADWIRGAVMTAVGFGVMAFVLWGLIKFQVVRYVLSRYVAPFAAIALALWGFTLLFPEFGRGYSILMKRDDPPKKRERYVPGSEFALPDLAEFGEFLAGIAPWIVIVLSGGAVVAVIVLSRRPPAPKAPPPRPSLEDGAKRAAAMLDDFSSFGGEKEAVILAYRSFLEVAADFLGKDRRASETAREFEGELEAEGVETESLRSLTVLFERARYSPAPLDPRDVTGARGSFDRIAESCAARAKARGRMNLPEGGAIRGLEARPRTTERAGGKK